MASSSMGSDPVDPLQSQFGVSLFSRTIRDPPPADPKDLESIHQLMKSVTLSSHEEVVEEAKAVKYHATKLLESPYGKFLESVGIDSNTFALEGQENVQERRRGLGGKLGKENVQEIRQGLGLKRARFTLKTHASTKPSAISEPVLDFEQPCDAETFFNTFEKAEEAKRELQRLKGGTVSDFNKYDQPAATRSRRPGMSGFRKSYIYKHRDSSDNYNSQMLSQDTQELDLPGSPSYESQKDKADTEFEAQETNVSGSDTESEKVYDSFLDELLSKSSEDLEGDGAVSILEERLSIKPIGQNTFSFPGLDVIGRTDSMAMREKLPKEKKTLTNISSLARRLSGEQKRREESPISPITSPSPPNVAVKRSSLCSPLRDPFALLDSDMPEHKKAFFGDDIDKQQHPLPVQKELSCSGNLEQRVGDELERSTTDCVDVQTVVPRASEESPISPITSPTPPNVTVGSVSLMKSPPTDPLSPLNIDLSEPIKALSGNNLDKQQPQLPVQKELSCSDNLEPQVEDELGRDATDSVELQTGVPRASESLIDCLSVENLEPQLEEDESQRSATSHVDLQNGQCLDKSLGQGSTDGDIWARESPGDVSECGTGPCENMVKESISVDRNLKDVTDESEAAVLPSQFNSLADDSTQTDSVSGVHQSHEPEGIPLKVAVHANPEINVSQTEENQSGHLSGQPNTSATEDNNADAPSIPEDIMTTKTSKKVQPKKAMRKRPRGECRELKSLSRRKSLAEAGTQFESGVRRSKRIKTRPLEYWKGERNVYGRIDESIKLVGLKYISPSRSERDLKVKPYISDNYKEVIDLASRY